MAAAIKVVEEHEIQTDGATEPSVQVAPAQAASQSQPPDPQIVAALHALNGRLQAVEGAIQGVPKTVGLIRTMTRALGANVLMTLALLGCLGLAGATAFAPSWQGAAISGGFAVLVYLPLAALAYWGKQ